jgi:DNA-binding XRE family transcriptional regulator
VRDPEAVWEMRRAMGRQLAAVRNRTGFSQWQLARVIGYSRSTLSDAELGRHRIGRKFWQRCQEALEKEDPNLVATYDRIEGAAADLRHHARKAAQAATQDQASAQLWSVLSADTGTGPAGGAARDAAVTMIQECPHCGNSVVILVLVGASLAAVGQSGGVRSGGRESSAPRVGWTENSPSGE